jgi:hypothetical protein
MRCTTTGSGRIERCSCVHRARNRLSPSRFTAGFDVDRSSAACSTSTNPRPETAGHVPRPSSRTRQVFGLDETNPLTAAIGFGALAILMLGSKFVPKLPWSLVILPAFFVRDRPNRASPRATKKAGDFPARKDQPSVVRVTRRLQIHCLRPRAG